MTTLEKPVSIKANKFKSDKWDELTEGRRFTKSDIPTLELLCHWHMVVETCINDLDDMNNQLFYENKLEDIKPMPQLAILKQASAEIRAINKQLGINDEAQSEQPNREVTVIHGLFENRLSRATNKSRTKAG